MARLFLATTLQTQPRNCHHPTQMARKTGPQNQTCAEAVDQRLEQLHRPRRIPSAPGNVSNATYPCAGCIADATILTTAEKKYTDDLNLRIRIKYTKSLPTCLRKTA